MPTVLAASGFVALPDISNFAALTAGADQARNGFASDFDQDGHGGSTKAKDDGRAYAEVVPTLSDFEARSIAGEELSLARYAGNVVLVVNTASKCGFTPQYEGLQALYERYAAQGLVVLGFPCDQFGHQEPGDESSIDDFCKVNFGVTFPLFAKVDVNGDQAHPLYRWLREQHGGVLGDAIKWNFTKFLIGRDGAVIDRYAPTTTPDKIAGDIVKALAAGTPAG